MRSLAVTDDDALADAEAPVSDVDPLYRRVPPAHRLESATTAALPAQLERIAQRAATFEPIEFATSTATASAVRSPSAVTARRRHHETFGQHFRDSQVRILEKVSPPFFDPDRASTLHRAVRTYYRYVIESNFRRDDR